MVRRPIGGRLATHKGDSIGTGEGNGANGRVAREGDEELTGVENHAQLGLVCELTLRVNRHSNGQESPLCHHFVF